MPPEDEQKKKLGRKLMRRRKEQSRPSFDIPERFRDGDDASEDVTAPKGQNTQYMNHSVFSMIAAAGSKVDFNARFDTDSSEGEGDESPAEAQQGVQEFANVAGDDKHPGSLSSKHRRKVSGHRLFRSLPRPNMKTGREKSSMSENNHGIQEEGMPSESAVAAATPRQVPVMSRLLEAEAQAQLSSLGQESGLHEHDELEHVERGEARGSPTNLSTRLMEIFEYSEPEEVISGTSIRLHCET
jgi:sterol 3beta-glucosyltransferase